MPVFFINFKTYYFFMEVKLLQIFGKRVTYAQKLKDVGTLIFYRQNYGYRTVIHM